ncbi:hypothetical protein D3C72_1214270 [compost metagenome]
MLSIYLFCVFLMLLAAVEFYLAEKKARSSRRAVLILLVGRWIALVAIFVEGNSEVRDLVGVLACMGAMLFGASLSNPRYQRK